MVSGNFRSPYPEGLQYSSSFQRAQPVFKHTLQTWPFSPFVKVSDINTADFGGHIKSSNKYYVWVKPNGVDSDGM
jgi:hypothetical protein